MEDFKKRADFRALLRDDLGKALKQYSYHLTFDNVNEDQQESKNWVFKLIYSGENVIEISNDDWRDYTEYYKVCVNGKEILTLNIDQYPDLQKALDEVVQGILNAAA